MTAVAVDPETGSVAFERVLLKLSGEALMGPREFGLDAATIDGLARELVDVHALGLEIALVIGGGNIYRGLEAAAAGMNRATGDYMGMLATVFNSLAVQEALERNGADTRVLSALHLREVAEPYIRRRAIRHLEKGRIVIFAAGTSNTYFSTDTAATLRALEIKAQVIAKATKVDGVYDKDPMKHTDAVMYRNIAYTQVLTDSLGVMDATSIAMCRDNKLPIIVFNMNRPGNIRRVV